MLAAAAAASQQRQVGVALDLQDNAVPLSPVIRPLTTGMIH